jgi:benzoyl-CoA reductase/2-hydroxyglutaryl-CoA dehydratase subunit BcrC/BadD/HgdB
MVAETPQLGDLPRRSEVIQRHKDKGGQIAAVFPIHYPRALFRAFDILPVEVWGPPSADVTLGDAHVQAYICSIVRCGYSFFLAGGLDVADYLVVPHACDSLQGLGSSLRDFQQPGKPVLTLYLPRGTDRTAVDFFADEIRARYEQLCDATGKRPADDELMQCIEREEHADAVLGELLDRRRGIDLDNAAFYRVVRSREYLPAEEFEQLALTALAKETTSPRGTAPIVLSGIIAEPRDLLEAITNADGIVVGDDLAASGRRRYRPGTSEDPFRRMAEGILSGPPCSTRGCSIRERADHLRALTTRTEAAGVVFLEIKFCEPEQFYMPQVRKALDDAGIRSAVIDVDVSDPLPMQAVTRLEAFLEMLV